MKIKYSKPKGQRIKKSTHKYRPLWIEIMGRGWWHVHELDQWVKDYPDGKHCSSCYYVEFGLNKIWSLKAAKRKIHKWDVPKGTVFLIHLPWVGHSIEITK